MNCELRFEQWIPVSLVEVFRFFSDPSNLIRLLPSALDARLVSAKIVPPRNAGGAEMAKVAGVGSEIAISIRILPFTPLRVRWIARITSFEMNHYFVDVQTKGPFHRFEHRHEFEAAARDGRPGTIVRDRIDYEVGFGILGRLLQRVLVARRVRSTFAHRQRTLEKLLAFGISS